MTTTATLTIDVGAKTCLEFAELAPRVNGPRALFMQGPIRQLDKDCGRRFEVHLVPYSIEKARWELEAAAEAHADKAARVPAVAERLKALIEAGDQTEDVFAIADLIRKVQDIGGNPFIR